MLVVAFGFIGPSLEDIRNAVKKHRIFFWVFFVLYLLLVVIIAIGKSGILSTGAPTNTTQTLEVKEVNGDIIISAYPDVYYQATTQEDLSTLTGGGWFLVNKQAGAVTVFLIGALIIGLIPVVRYFEQRVEEEGKE